MIICNGRILGTHLTGVQRYTSKILKFFPDNAYKVIYPDEKFISGIKGHFWEQLLLPPKIKKKDLLWSPSNAGPISVKNQILTIHDVVSLDHPEWLNKNYVKWYDYMLPRLAKNVKHIITISQYSKERIIATLNVPDDKVSVIYNGVDDEFFNPDTQNVLDLPFKRYILALGSIEPRKNLKLLMSYWENIVDSLPEDIGLIIVGKAGFSRVFGKVDIDKEVKNVFFTGHVDDKFLPTLYSNALFFMYLSDYEGFGLPPLEAMAAGCPVITSNLTSLPEVVGDCAITLDPYDQPLVEKTILNFIEDTDLRLKFSEMGIKRAKGFSWKTASQQTWDLINEFV